MGALAAALGAAPRALVAETLDRVLASVGHTAITQSDVEAEYRFEYFVENQRAPAAGPDAPTSKTVLDHLINQEVMVQEANAEGASRVAASGRASERLAELRGKFADQAAFEAALRALGMTERQVLDRFTERQSALLLIDQQLRPLATVEPSEIEAYYRKTFVPKFAQQNRGAPPPLTGVEAEIREILVQQKIDQLLPGWLNKLKSSHPVRIYAASGSP